MGRSRRIRAALLLAVASGVSLALGGATQAGPPGTWTRITDPTGSNTQQLGLARTNDRALHVGWLRAPAGGKGSVMHSSITPAGRSQAPNAIVTGWAGVNVPDLVRLHDGRLRVYFGGIRSGARDPQQSLNTAVAESDGKAWELQVGSATTSTRAYASPMAAVVKRDGTPVVTWVTTFALEVQTGVDPNVPPQVYENRCCAPDPNLAVDGSSGELVLGWFSLVRGDEGYWTQSIDPRKTKQKVPGSGRHDGQRMALSGRIGAPGVYFAFCDGSPCKNVVVWRHGTSSLRRITPAAGARFVNIAAAPSGRLWVTWMLANKLYTTRSNKAATAFGPIVATAPPAQTSQIWSVDGEGSAGPLDLFASASTSRTSLAWWHTQVYPQLTLTASPRTFSASKGGKVTFTVRDAGDPVKGATVKVGGKAGATSAGGKVAIAFAAGTKSGTYRATASLAGYRAASVNVTAG